MKVGFALSCRERRRIPRSHCREYTRISTCIITRLMEKRVQIGLKLPPSLIERVDAIRAQMDFPPDRTEVIERAITEWCDRIERERGKKRR